MNIEFADEKAQRRRGRGMEVADLTDHDTIDDPVEMANIEAAEAKKKK